MALGNPASAAGNDPASRPHEATEWRRAIEAVLVGPPVTLAAQPIVDLVNARVVGYELLSRFPAPPAAPPDAWFRWAETLGYGAALEARAVTSALAQRDHLPPDTFITINVDPAHLEDRRLFDVLGGAGSLERVVLELTEHHVIDDYPSIVRRLQPLRDAGAKVAIDDAGSGYAGLQWLLALAPDMIKLDRALIDHVDEDVTKIALIEMLGAFADRIDAWVLAEGVERVPELDVLMRLGVPLAQGYLLARPALNEWPNVDADLLRYLDYRTTLHGGDLTVGTLVETVLTRRPDEVRHAGLTVVVDERRQPVALDLPELSEERILTIRPNETARSALERAMLRAPANRWQPLVCVDDVRQTLGIVRMESLIQSLVRSEQDDETDTKESP